MTSVPSPQLPNGEAALDSLMGKTRSIRAAVAFVTRGGVDLLSGLLDRHPHIENVSIVARGAPITEPSALLALRDQLNVDVAVLTGAEAARFHPKVWLLHETTGELWVLSGSGNLTAGGLHGNREQFEILHVVDSAAVEAQEERLDALTEDAIPLDHFEGSIAWKTWTEQLDRRAKLDRQLQDLNEALAKSHPIDREAHKQQLMDDLWEIYKRTLGARLRRGWNDLRSRWTEAPARRQAWAQRAGPDRSEHLQERYGWLRHNPPLRPVGPHRRVAGRRQDEVLPHPFSGGDPASLGRAVAAVPLVGRAIDRYAPTTTMRMKAE